MSRVWNGAGARNVGDFRCCGQSRIKILNALEH